jgi:hypothetical protein
MNMGTRADFFIGVGPAAEWIGSVSYDGGPREAGVGPLSATTEAKFREAVEHLLMTWSRPVTRPEEGWPWPWEDFRTTDYAYAWDPARGSVASAGRAWVTRQQLKENSGCIYEGALLRDDEVPDMSRGKRGDILAKSGLMFLKVPT